MTNIYKISEANEDNNLHSNLQWSASVFVTFQSLLRRSVASANPESEQPHLKHHLGGRLCHQDAAADVKTDRNSKTNCLDCMVDVASDPTPAYRASIRSSH
ncbi:hypothetical protein TNCV_1223951 [Trichonephila clavipes]|nr:hypothetical protein TNCV_1223951 [Trichonephila clavipes]